MKNLPLIKIPEWLQDPNPNLYLSDNYVVVDFETTIIDKGSPYEELNRIVSAGWRLGPAHPARIKGECESGYIKGNEFEQQEVVAKILEADFWIAHNSKFEHGWLDRAGLGLGIKPVWCTQIGEYIWLSNRHGRTNLSDSLVRRGITADKDALGSALLKAGVCPSTWLDEWLRKYQNQDPEVTEKLFLIQRKHFIETEQLPLIFTRNMLTPVLVDIEKQGMHLDKERVLILHEQYNKKLQELRTEIDKITGGANPNSPKQMREVLYEHLKFKKPTDSKWLGKHGEPTTKFDYIDTLKPRNKKQEQFKKLKQEYSKVNAALTKSLNKFRDCVEETEDHILTASLNQTVTATQRLSSTGKNYRAQFQNFARIFKPLFAARHEDWNIIEHDQAQLEYRTAVWYGQDEAGLHDILNGVDAHGFTATEIYGDKFLSATGQIREAIRTASKSRTFKPLYGGESGTPDEKRYYAAFKEKHQGISKTQALWKAEAVSTQQVKIPTGVIFYFPGTKVLDDGYITNSTNIVNYPVQSLATADIVPIGLVYQWYLVRADGLRAFIINTVHDSILGEVPPEETERYNEIGQYANTEIVVWYLKKVYNIDFNVPLQVDVKAALHWADTEEWRKKYLTS